MKAQILSVLFLSLPAMAFAGESVDLQWTVCDSSPEKVLSKIGQEDAKQKDQKVTYMDTQKPSFIQDGITFRVKMGKKKHESSLKIRFPHATKVDGADCSWDRYGLVESYTCEVISEQGNDAPLWSQEQEDFLHQYHGDREIPTLREFGPYTDPKWKFDFGNYTASFDSVEAPGVGHLMEFSLKVERENADAQAEAFGAFLLKHNVMLCPNQESKTMRLFRSTGLVK